MTIQGHSSAGSRVTLPGLQDEFGESSTTCVTGSSTTGLDISRPFLQTPEGQDLGGWGGEGHSSLCPQNNTISAPCREPRPPLPGHLEQEAAGALRMRSVGKERCPGA